MFPGPRFTFIFQKCIGEISWNLQPLLVQLNAAMLQSVRLLKYLFIELDGGWQDHLHRPQIEAGLIKH